MQVDISGDLQKILINSRIFEEYSSHLISLAGFGAGTPQQDHLENSQEFEK